MIRSRSPKDPKLSSINRLLIERVKEYPIVYNRNHEYFRHASKKQQAWEDIGKHIGLDEKKAAIRWKTLRDRYVREMKKNRLHPGKKEALALFQLMDFLRPFIQTKVKNILKPRRGADSDSTICKLITILDSDDEGENSLYDEDPSTLTDGSCSNWHTPTYGEDGEVDFVSDTSNDCVETSNERETPTETAPADEPENPPSYELINCDEFLSSPASITSGEFEGPSNSVQEEEQQPLQQKEPPENADDFFCKTIAIYLSQLQRRHKIKAEVEMLQILQKYIDLEESEAEGRQTMAADSSA